MKMTHKHDVYFSPHSIEAYNLVMQIADYCNKRGIWYKISESTLGIGIVYGGNVGYVIDADRKDENSSEKPNNCEHITEDGVTCAKYPACDDCPDNPLNKVKGSERLVKGSEQTDCGDFADRLAYERGVKHAWEVAQKVFNSTVTFYEAEDVAKQIDKDINVRSKDEPQTETEIAKAIVHKMIDDAVIAEDAYPDLRQKMHDAVDEYEPLTGTDLKEVCREEDDEFTDRLIEEQLANKLLTDCAWRRDDADTEASDH